MALTDKLSAIGDAIRVKTGKTAGMTLDQMPGEIAGISGGGTLGAISVTENGVYSAAYETASFTWDENTEYDGICKLVINKKTNTLIGAHIIGSYAGEYIVAVSALIDLEVDIENIKKLVFPHPTVCEIIRETVFSIK